MKKFITIFCFTMLGLFSNAQNKIIEKVKVTNDLTEVNIYYEDGAIMQHGFYTKEGKLHNSWESYHTNGSLKCVAFYKEGVKVGTWTYWDDGIISKVEYKNNEVVSIKEFQESELIKNEI